MKNYCHLSGHVTGRRKPCEKGALCRKGILPASALSIIHGVRIALRARDVSLQSNVHAHTHTGSCLQLVAFCSFRKERCSGGTWILVCSGNYLLVCLSNSCTERSLHLHVFIFHPCLQWSSLARLITPPKKSIFCLKTAYLALCLQSASPKNCEF